MLINLLNLIIQVVIYKKLFLISRFANSIFFINIIFFSRICEVLEIKNELIIIALIGIVLSNTSTLNLIILRADGLPAFMLAAFYFILSFAKSVRKISNYFVRILYIIGSFSKIQAVIILIPILCFIFIFINNEFNEEINLNIIKI